MDIPNKVKGKDLYYLIIKEQVILATYKNQLALHYKLSEEEWEKLAGHEGVYVQTKNGKYVLSSKNTTLWSTQLYSNLSWELLDKETSIRQSHHFAAKWRYKREAEVADLPTLTTFRFTNCPYIVFIPKSTTSSPLSAFINKPLEENIVVREATDPRVLNELTQFLSFDSVYTIDTETYDPEELNGWKALVGWLCCIRMLQIYSPKLDRTYIIDFGARGSYAIESIRHQIGEILNKKLIGKECEYQNALFDLMVLECQLGFLPYHTKIRDTMSMSKNLWAGIGLLSHSLEGIAQRLNLGETDKSLQKSDFGLELVPAQYNYGAKDVIITHHCRVLLEQKLNEVGQNKEFALLDNAYTHVCHMIRRHGFYIDSDKLNTVEEVTRRYYDEKCEQWLTMSGLEATASSAALVAWFTAQGHPIENAQQGTMKELAKTVPAAQVLLDAKAAGKRLQYLEGVADSLTHRTDNCTTPGILVSARQGLGRTSEGDLVRGKHVGINCFTLDHEILVKGKGWVPIVEAQRGDYTYAYKEGRIQESKLLDVFTQEYTGTMYNFKLRYLTQHITADHGLWFKGDEKIAAMEALSTKRCCDLVISANPLATNCLSSAFSDTELKFIVAVLADGNYVIKGNAIAFGFTKQRKIERLTHLLDSLGLKYRKFISGTSSVGTPVTHFRIRRSELTDKIRETLPQKQLTHDFIYSLTAAQNAVVVSELCYWDGSELTKPNSQTRSFQFARSAGDADIFAELVLRAGYLPMYAKPHIKNRSNPSIRFSWRNSDPLVSDKLLKHCLRKQTVNPSKNPVTFVEYEVENLLVGCVTTEHGSIIVRTPKGKVEISGNCQNMGKEMREYPELPDYRPIFAAPPGYKLISHDLCLDMQATSVLTSNRGVIPLSEVTLEDTVYSWDAKTNTVVKTPVLATICLEYTGVMYKWRGTYITQRMTAGHRIPLRDGRYVYPEDIAAQESKDRVVDVFVSDLLTSANSCEGGTNPHNLTEADVRFMVAMAADGHYPPEAPRSCVFYGSREDKFERHVNLLQNKFGFEATMRCSLKHYKSYKWIIHYKASKRIAFLRSLMPNKALPRLLLDLPLKLREAAFDELKSWDGSLKCSGAYFEYSTIRIEEAHIALELALSLGYLATIKTNSKSLTNSAWSPCYKVRIKKKDGIKSENVRHTSPLWGKGNKNKYRRYDAYEVESLPVGCLKTQTTNFFILTEDGRVELTGNCASHMRLAMKFAGCTSLQYLAPGEDSHSYNASFIAASAEQEYPDLLSNYEKLKVIRKLDFDTLVLPDWLTASVAKPVYKKAKQYRDIAKTAIYTAINFGGPARLQESLKKVGITLSLEECKDIMASLWNAVPEIKEHVMQAKNFANKQDSYRPIELTMQTISEWEAIEDDEEQQEARKKPVGYGKLYTATGFLRYIPKYVQTGWGGKTYVSCSISDVSATLWQNPEARVIKRSQVRFLVEYIVPRRYHLVTESGFPSVWICNQAHDEILVTAREDLALEASTWLMRIMKEEWEAVCPGILGLEGEPEGGIGANWGETK